MCVRERESESVCVFKPLFTDSTALFVCAAPPGLQRARDSQEDSAGRLEREREERGREREK